jgi:ABC-2 type transport system ATP-binding protein
MNAAIEIRNLRKSFDHFHLGPLDLDVPRGAICALIGPNGAGKSTTLDILMGIGKAGGGDIRMLGWDLNADEVEIKRRTAYVSPELNFVAWKTVGKAIEFVRGFYPDWDSQRCDRLLAEFGLRLEDRISALSFGTRIKLSVVLALSRNAELLLLDEPTVGLDAVAKRQLFAELLSFMQREDRSILISSHQLSDLERFADHVIIIDRGRLVASGRMDALVEQYRIVRILSTPHLGRLKNPPRVIKQDGEQSEVLVNLAETSMHDLIQAGIEVLNESPVSLEDLLIALVGTPKDGQKVRA